MPEPNVTDSPVTNSIQVEESATSSQLELPVSTSGGEEDSTKPFNGQDIPMLNEYQLLGRVEAIKKLLQKHAGIVCHIDFIVRALYGELEPDAFKVVKDRVQSTLIKGKRTGKWSSVPGELGCYTIDLSLVDSRSKVSSSKSKQAISKKTNSQAKTNNISLKGEFKGKVLIDAISSLLKQNPQKVFHVDEIIHSLYGELEPEQLRELRPKVLKDLSRGYQTGRFSKVPEEKGLYLISVRRLPP